jgi:hypothetical protein
VAHEKRGPHGPQGAGTLDYTEFRRLENAIVSIGKHYGLYGDCFAECPRTGTPRQELTIVNLILELPRYLRRSPEIVRAMVRAFVMSAIPDDEAHDNNDPYDPYDAMSDYSGRQNGTHSAIVRATTKAIADRRKMGRGPRK